MNPISRLTGAKLELRAQNLPLQFNMSTVAGLGDLVEDEFLPTPLPMEVGADILFGIDLRVSHLLVDLGWVDFDLGVPPSCLAA